MCSLERAASRSRLDRIVDVDGKRLGAHRGGAGDLAQREHGGDGDADLDGEDEVEGEGDERGDDEHRPRRCAWRAITARTLCGSTMRTAVTIRTPASAASGILRHQRAAEVHDGDEDDRVHDRRQLGCAHRRAR